MVIGKDLLKPQLTPALVECCQYSEPAAAVRDDDRRPAVDVEVHVVAVERGAECAVVVVVDVVDAAVAVAVVVAAAVARVPAGIALAAAAAHVQASH